MVMDVTDGIWSMMGRAMHSLAEVGADANHIAEERLHTTVKGWTLSGGIDLQILRDGVAAIEDYKVTSAWAVMNDKPEWETQLNVYAYLVAKVKGWTVDQLNVIAFIRDWARMKANTQEGYPSAPVIRVPVKLWTFAEQEAYVEARVQMHQSAATADQFDDDLPHCTDEERWVKQSKFAVMKPGRKTAVRVFDTKAEADAFSADNAGTEVVERPGAATRCAENFCSVSQWCTQWQTEKGETE
jgi:hypothetical protein